MNDSSGASRLPLLLAAGGAVAVLLVALVAAGLWWTQRPAAVPSRPQSAAAGSMGERAPGEPGAESTPSAAPSAVERFDEPAAAGDGAVRFELAWGQGHGELGRGTSEFGYPGGPNSFAVGADGSTWILDQFNQRMVRLGPDGKVLETRALKVQAAADLAIDKQGNMAVMDRSKDQRVDLYDKAGRNVGALPLPPENGQGPLDRVFVDGGKVYGQRGDGGPMVWLGGVDGQRAPEGQDEINGQPSRDGTQLLGAGITDHDAGRVWVSGASAQTQEVLWTREFALDVELEHTLLLDSDNQGVIYYVVKGLFGESDAKAMVLCLDGTQRGAPIKMFMLSYPQAPLDTFRAFEVQPSGGLLAAQETPTGMGFRLYQCR